MFVSSGRDRDVASVIASSLSKTAKLGKLINKAKFSLVLLRARSFLEAFPIIIQSVHLCISVCGKTWERRKVSVRIFTKREKRLG
jgi:hypothetical protein